MPGIFLTIILLSLLSAVSTSEYPKSLEGWYPTWERMRDRRTSHWDSRSISNLYDDRRREGGEVDNDDRESSEILYPFIVEQRSSLGFPAASFVESTTKSLNEIGYQNKESIDSDSRFERCIAVEPKSFGSINESPKQNNYPFNVQSNSGIQDRFETLRCHRKPEGWTLQNPVYVEEPNWISIDLNRQNRGANGLSTVDPFYVARGKRFLRSSDIDRRARTKKDLKNIEESSDKKNSKNNDKQTVNRRKKRNALSDILGSSLIQGQPLTTIEGLSVDRGTKGQSYVGPRNKHSDLLDILNEPFFISRGKKNFLTSKGFVPLDWYKKNPRKQFQDDDYLLISDYENEENIGNCDPRLNNCLVEFEINKNRYTRPRSIVDNSIAIRDRRGFMEDILKDTDPFYLARG